MGRKKAREEVVIRRKKDPCRCSEHECKQMLFTNEVLRRSLKKLLVQIVELKRKLGIITDEEATPGAVIVPLPTTDGGCDGKDSQGGGQV